MKAQGWGCVEGSIQCHTLVLADMAGEGNKEDLIKKGLLDSGDFLIWEVEVKDWMEASILYNEFQAWGPYRPMREDAEEYEAALRKLMRDGMEEYQEVIKKLHEKETL